MPNPIPWSSSHHIRCYSQNSGWTATPQLQGCRPLLGSCGQHMTIMQPCATCTTLLVGHLAGGPEGPNPLFFQSISILLHANVLLIVLQCPHAYLFSILTWRQIVCAPVPCSHPHLLHPHADSCLSYRCLPDHILIANLCLQPCGSILFK